MNYEPYGISISNQCPECSNGINLVGVIDTREIKCANCMLDGEARLSELAHEIVDEGNIHYKRQWLITTEPRAHDWVSPTTRIKPYFVWVTQSWEDTRSEYKPPVTNLQDGGELDNVWEIQDYTQSQRETECPWCHLLTPKIFNECQDCDQPLERNVR